MLGYRLLLGNQEQCFSNIAATMPYIASDRQAEHILRQQQLSSIAGLPASMAMHERQGTPQSPRD